MALWDHFHRGSQGTVSFSHDQPDKTIEKAAERLRHFSHQLLCADTGVAGMDDDGTSLPLWHQGRSLREPPDPRSRDRFRINLTGATGL